MSMLSVQMYTLKKLCAQDYDKALRFCAEAGFDGVEYHCVTPIDKTEFKELLEKNGLVLSSSIFDLEIMEKNLDEVMRFNELCSNRRIVMPYFYAHDEETIDQCVSRLKPIAKELKNNGFKLYYHNHGHEMKKIKGRYILDILFDKIGADLIKLELDCFWAWAGGVDPVAFLLDHRDHVDDVIHIKDGFNLDDCTPLQASCVPAELKNGLMGGRNVPSALGRGNVPVAEVMKTAKELGIEWLILEDDQAFPTEMEDVEYSLKLMKLYR